MQINGNYIESCHLFTDGTEAFLLEFAVAMGLRRHWLQHRALGKAQIPHFDLTPKNRRRALKAGALEVSRAQAVEIWRHLALRD